MSCKIAFPFCEWGRMAEQNRSRSMEMSEKPDYMVYTILCKQRFCMENISAKMCFKIFWCILMINMNVQSGYTNGSSV